MSAVLYKLWKDDAGFVLSAELMLIATIVILATIVGLSEVSLAVNQELRDVSSAFGAVNQGFDAGGTASSSNEQSSIVGGEPEPEAN